MGSLAITYSTKMVKAGKLAKPKVAMATPPFFTARKKLSQCRLKKRDAPNKCTKLLGRPNILVGNSEQRRSNSMERRNRVANKARPNVRSEGGREGKE